ncbi:hypothetical protein G4D37_16420 [Burkholderia pseudomallei]|uniref:hypothetical protein n=1 Tax=Burkholderia pseudomallei TaxID=28450 RepID=UPI0015933EF2|nr:hypothetical protein [Burkholderia pseudomallei]MBF3495706.1 hypothetical protein [Burkholderia pseudomallei]NVH67775.1 hypothetical protein [Burkholderia pseudomallei]
MSNSVYRYMAGQCGGAARARSRVSVARRRIGGARITKRRARGRAQQAADSDGFCAADAAGARRPVAPEVEGDRAARGAGDAGGEDFDGVGAWASILASAFESEFESESESEANRIETRRDEEPSRVQPQPDSTQASEKLQTDLLRENHPELLLSSPAARSYRGAQAMRFALSASRDSGGWQ